MEAINHVKEIICLKGKYLKARAPNFGCEVDVVADVLQLLHSRDRGKRISSPKLEPTAWPDSVSRATFASSPKRKEQPRQKAVEENS